ncbi:lysis protein [Proteus mirabilis]|nr:lysis protein [Proteus mirabilis]
MKYGKLYAVIVVVGITVGGYWVINRQANRINLLIEKNKELTIALEEQKSINADYQVRIERLNQLDTRHTQELVNAKNEINTLRDAVNSGDKRVYVKAECPAVTKNSTESGINEATARLNKAVEQDYLRLREMIVENEQQTLYLQDYIRTECLK